MDQTMVPAAHEFTAERRRAVPARGDSNFNFPPDLQGRETELLLSKRTAERIARRIEGDAVPAATFGALLLEAHWARMPRGEKLRIAVLAAGDVAIGWMPLVGQVLRRPQAASARRVAAHAAQHLELIRDASRQLSHSGETVPEDDPVLTGLREALFGPRKRRGGRTWHLPRVGRHGSARAAPGTIGVMSPGNVPAEGDRHAVA